MKPEEKKGNRKFSIAFIVIILGICCCVVVAVLMGLSLFGTAAVQATQRDTQRKAVLHNIDVEVASYYSVHGTFPQVTFSTTSGVTIGTSVDSITYPLTGVTSVAPKGFTSSSTNTSYCYKSDYKTSYQLGVYLEGSGGWGTEGSAQQVGNGGACGTANE